MFNPFNSLRILIWIWILCEQVVYFFPFKILQYRNYHHITGSLEYIQALREAWGWCLHQRGRYQHHHWRLLSEGERTPDSSISLFVSIDKNLRMWPLVFKFYHTKIKFLRAFLSLSLKMSMELILRPQQLYITCCVLRCGQANSALTSWFHFN